MVLADVVAQGAGPPSFGCAQDRPFDQALGGSMGSFTLSTWGLLDESTEEEL